MPAIATHRPGTFCWWELATPDCDTAYAYYRTLFGWGKQDSPAGDGTYYRMLDLHGRHVGAMYQLTQEQLTRGVPASWLCYLAVEDVDAIARHAEHLGAKLIQPPFEVFDYGRMAVFEDPTGAKCALWQPGKHVGAGIVGELGSATWSELGTSDPSRAKAFYSELLGWVPVDKPGPMPYTEWHPEGGPPAGGMYRLGPEMGPIPSYWGVYFRVADCDESVQESNQAGGGTLVPPTDIPGVGRFAMLTDPTGALFCIVQLAGER